MRPPARRMKGHPARRGGFLAAADVNLMAHANGSTAGGLLETSSRAYGGLVFGVAKPYDTEYGRVDVGVGVKYISQNSYEGALGVTELTDQTDDLGKKLQDKYEKQSSGFGVRKPYFSHNYTTNKS